MNLRKAKKRYTEHTLKICRCPSIRVQRDLSDLFGGIELKTDWWCFCNQSGVYMYFEIDPTPENLELLKENRVRYLREFYSDGTYTSLLSEVVMENKSIKYYWSGPGSSSILSNGFFRPCSHEEIEFLESRKKEYKYIGTHEFIAVKDERTLGCS